MNPIERIEAAADALERVAATDLSAVCWISGGNSDQGNDWCLSCANIEAARLRSQHPGTEFFVEGACGAYEAEHSCACTNCGATLEYSLLHYGVISEVDHFLSYPLTQDEGAIVAYEIQAILREARWLKQEEDGQLIEDALRVGETAVQLIGYRHELARLADDGGPA